MPSDTNLKDTLKEAATETKVEETPKETVETPVEETTKEVSGDSAETDAGETVESKPVYVKGIDISDIPEADRERVSELLDKKASLLEKGYQTKFQEVAELKRTLEELESRGISQDEARNAINDYDYRKRNPVSTEKKDAMKTLDKLIADAPSEQKASLEQFRRIVKEETNVGELKKELSELKNLVGVLSQTSVQTRVDRVSKELNQLSGEYGEEFVNKYKKEVLRQGQQYNVSAERLLFAIADPIELKKIISAKASPKRTVTKEKKEAITSPSSGVKGREAVDIKQHSLKSLIKSLGKNK